MTEKQTGSDAEQGKTLLEGILERMAIPSGVDVREDDDKVYLTIECEEDEDTQRVIGRRGQVVDALQHLVSKMIARGREERGKPLVVDCGGYRQRHVERLEGLADRMAEKARKSGTPVDLSPMPAFDRRIIHLYLAEMEGIATRSEGEGDDRHIVVVPE